MNILLTGGAGYIGSHTSLLLIDKGHEVTIVDNLISGNSKLVPKKANFINSDISDEKKIRSHYAFCRLGESGGVTLASRKI